MRTVPLNESGSVRLDGSGNGTVRIGPDEPAARWLPTVASVSALTAAPVVNEAQCLFYAGQAPVQQYFVDGTFSGSSGDSSDRITGRVISRTQLPYIWAVWTGGDPGAQATLSVSGTKEIP